MALAYAHDIRLNTAPINPDPDTPHTYGLIKNWISDCADRHGNKRSTFNQGPRRLLCIEKAADTYNLTLQAVNTHQVDYVALSYCWGGDQVHMTTKENYASINRVICFESLPKTLQDAIEVTTELGYCFLWVDSLCIVQDCPVDKSREIANMPAIYNSAVLTIAASTAASTTEGFLQARSTRVPIISKVRFEDGSLEIHNGGMVELDSYKCETLPLDSRAWALQEALLSVHVLEYCSL
jgi:hypothetical protein